MSKIRKDDPITERVTLEFKQLDENIDLAENQKYAIARERIDQIYQDRYLCTVKNLVYRIKYLEHLQKTNYDNIKTLLFSLIVAYITWSIGSFFDIKFFSDMPIWLYLTMIVVSGIVIFALIFWVVREAIGSFFKMEKNNVISSDKYFTTHYEVEILKERLENEIENQRLICANMQAHPHDADGLDKCTNQTTLLSEPEKPCR